MQLQSISMRGLYTIQRKRFGKVVQEEHFHNLVCKQLAGYFLTYPSYCYWQYCQLGSGTTSPTTNDTHLATRLWGMRYTSVEIESTSADGLSRTWKAVYTFPANSNYVGTIREVGLAMGEGGGGYNTLTTHALLVDGEGHQLEIEKTYLDEIIVTAHITITRPAWSAGETWPFECGPLSRHDPMNLIQTNTNGAGSGTSLSLTPCWYPEYRPGVVCNASSFFNDLTYNANTSSINGYAEFSREAYYDAIAKYFTSRGHLRGTPFTDYINSLCFGAAGYSNHDGYNNPALKIKLPNANIFPVSTIENLSLGTGDGTTTDFAPELPAWLANSEKVYINGTQQTRGVDYQVDHLANLDKMWSVMLGNFIKSVDAEYVEDSFVSLWGTVEVGFTYNDEPVTCKAPVVSKDRPMILTYSLTDCFQPAKVNYFCLGHWRAPGKILAGASLVFYYCTQGSSTWVEFGRITLASDGGNNETFFSEATNPGNNNETCIEHTMQTVNSIEKVKIALENTDTDLRVFCWSRYLGRFGYVGDYAIRFTNPPATGAVLTMDCDIDRPWKSNKNNVRWNSTVTFNL